MAPNQCFCLQCNCALDCIQSLADAQGQGAWLKEARQDEERFSSLIGGFLTRCPPPKPGHR
eukprot:12902649-Prorocentrum_lima.AAC.1